MAICNEPSMSLGRWDYRIYHECNPTNCSLVVGSHGVVSQSILTWWKTLRLVLFCTKYYITAFINCRYFGPSIHFTNKVLTFREINSPFVKLLTVIYIGSNLRFADDVVLFSESPQELQLMVEELRTANNKVDLEINESKTKVMLNINVEIQPIMTGNVALDQQATFNSFFGVILCQYHMWSDIKSIASELSFLSLKTYCHHQSSARTGPLLSKGLPSRSPHVALPIYITVNNLTKGELISLNVRTLFVKCMEGPKYLQLMNAVI
ncbi:hypothetical protein GQR58_007262 [Nymphon striatum]|nr:hypothetical protein GQR58_007262 [Nymphon striatum]